MTVRSMARFIAFCLLIIQTAWPSAAQPLEAELARARQLTERARFLSEQGELASASDLHAAAFRIQKKHLPPMHPETVSSLLLETLSASAGKDSNGTYQVLLKLKAEFVDQFDVKASPPAEFLNLLNLIGDFLKQRGQLQQTFLANALINRTLENIIMQPWTNLP